MRIRVYKTSISFWDCSRASVRWTTGTSRSSLTSHLAAYWTLVISGISQDIPSILYVGYTCYIYIYNCYVVVGKLSDLYRSGMHTPRNICEHGITDTRTAMTATSATELQDQIHLSTACSTWANRWSDRTLVGFTCWDSQMRQSEEHRTYRTLRKIVGNPNCQSPTIYSWKFLEALTHFDPTGLSGPDGISVSQPFPSNCPMQLEIDAPLLVVQTGKKTFKIIFVDLNSLRSE